jgi:hypothetical protein
MADDSKVELRGECRRDVVDVVDAVSFCHGMTRMQMVNLILIEWATKRKHEAKSIQRLTRSNPAEAEESGFGADALGFVDSRRGGL